MVTKLTNTDRKDISSNPLTDEAAATKYAFNQEVMNDQAFNKNPLNDRSAATKYAFQEDQSENFSEESVANFEQSIGKVVRSMKEIAHEHFPNVDASTQANIVLFLVREFGNRMLQMHAPDSVDEV